MSADRRAARARDDEVLDRIKRTVASIHRMKVDELEGRSRQADIVKARNIAMFLAHDMTAMGYGRIGLEFGQREYSTVRDAVTAMGERLGRDGTLALGVAALREAVVRAMPEFEQPAARESERPDLPQRLRERNPQSYGRPKPARAKLAERSCLKCGETFLSEGPHNRICGRCKRRVERTAAMMEGVTW